jgi:hypothetical protein
MESLHTVYPEDQLSLAISRNIQRLRLSLSNGRLGSTHIQNHRASDNGKNARTKIIWRFIQRVSQEEVITGILPL